MAEENVNFFTPGFIKLYFAIFIAYLNSAINGYDLSLMGGLYVEIPFQAVFGPFDTNQDALLFALLQIGSISGCFFVGFTCDYFGRKIGMQFGSLCIIVGTVLEVSTQSQAVFMFGRFLIGFGVIFVTTAAPTYVVEVSHPAFRGRATAFYNTGWNVGAVPAAALVYGFSYVDTNVAWQVPAGLQGVFSLIVFLGCFFIPESPRWMIAKGKTDQAIKFLTKYHASGEEGSEIVQLQLAEIQDALADEKAQKTGTYISFLTTSANRYRLLLLVCVSFFSQYAGNWLAGYFETQIETYFGITDNHSVLLFNCITSIISWLASLLGTYFVDKLGRRFLLFWGSVSYALSYLLMLICLAIYNDGANIAAGIGAFILLNIFAICYSLTWTPLNALYPVEVLAYGLRARGMALTQLMINVANVFQSYVLANGLSAYTWKFFSFYLVFNTMAAVVVYFFFPETKGRTLEELDEIFNSKNKVKASLLPPKSRELGADLDASEKKEVV
jgi:sugar porter (SP) family MFS transporter